VTKQVILMFPGQSSRYPAMIEKVVSAHPDCAEVVRRASAILQRDLLQHYRADNGEVFATNRDVQVGVFIANHLHLMLLEEAGVRTPWSLGLSLGEYNHLVHIGAMTFEDALSLVDARGQLYDESEGGMMVSLYPVEAALVEEVIGELGLTGKAAVGLYNSPRQQVLSGEREAVEQVVAALDERVYVDASVIEPRIPMHAPVFEPIGARLAAILERTPMTAPRAAYVPNVLGTVVEDATAARIRECLTAHTYQAVRWQASVDAVAARVPSPCFVEVGPRAVLYNLFGRGWTPGKRATTDAVNGFSDYLLTIASELSHAS
jgi:[acyl-carrier-protein] S-malonyltransferase